MMEAKLSISFSVHMMLSTPKCHRHKNHVAKGSLTQVAGKTDSQDRPVWPGYRNGRWYVPSSEWDLPEFPWAPGSAGISFL